MPKQKILFVITKSNWGGAQKYVFDLASRLSPATFDVAVLFGGHGILAEKLEERNIRTLSFPTLWRDVNFFEDSKAFFKLFFVYRKERPDVVHLNSSKIGGLGALAARLAGVRKIIFTVHGWAFNEPRPAWQKVFIKFLSWVTTFLCTDIIFISQKELDQAQHWPFITHKAHLVHNGIQAPEFKTKQEAREIIFNHAHIPESARTKTIVGSIAELTKNKGLLYALEACISLPDHIYVIIGAGEEEQNLKDYIQKNNLSEKVFLAGFVKNAAEVLKAFDVFLLPSLKEGLPYVLIEAGHAQLSVIATKVGAIDEIIKDTKTGLLIEPRSPQAIKNALVHLQEYKSMKEEMSTALTETVLQKFSLENMLTKTSEIYTSK